MAADCLTPVAAASPPSRRQTMPPANRRSPSLARTKRSGARKLCCRAREPKSASWRCLWGAGPFVKGQLPCASQCSPSFSQGSSPPRERHGRKARSPRRAAPPQWSVRSRPMKKACMARRARAFAQSASKAQSATRAHSRRTVGSRRGSAGSGWARPGGVALALRSQTLCWQPRLACGARAASASHKRQPRRPRARLVFRLARRAPPGVGTRPGRAAP